MDKSGDSGSPVLRMVLVFGDRNMSSNATNLPNVYLDVYSPGYVIDCIDDGISSKKTTKHARAKLELARKMLLEAFHKTR